VDRGSITKSLSLFYRQLPLYIRTLSILIIQAAYFNRSHPTRSLMTLYARKSLLEAMMRQSPINSSCHVDYIVSFRLVASLCMPWLW